MFAKRTKQTSPPQGPTDDGSQTVQSGPDPRDDAIERLERELAEERQSATKLRESLDAATFKSEILEKSYAKQLADARERLAATEQKLGEKVQVLATLDGGHEDALRALNELRAEHKLVTAERDRLHQQLSEGGFRQRAESATRAPLGLATPDATDTGGTINQLISNAGWAPRKSAAVGDGNANAQVSEQDTPQEEMLSPELVFTKDGDDEDDDAR